MSRLVKRHIHKSPLFDHGFLVLDRPTQLATYNMCLRMINLPPTERSVLRIDAWGWSPEIATDLGDEFYLSQNGPANPFAIIVSPDQEHCKLHFPYYSFDLDLIKSVFHTYRTQIADITTEQGIVLTVDQRISQYQTPFDLLLIDHFNLGFKATGGIITAAKQQRALVHSLYNNLDSWKDWSIYHQLVESAAQHGDLRYRSLEMEGMPFNRMHNFYTKAFGGVFVFRGLKSGRPLMVFEDASFMAEMPGNSIRVIHIDDRDALLKIMAEEELIEWNAANRNDLVPRIMQWCECLFTRAFAYAYAGQDVIGFEHGGFRSFEADLLTREFLDPLYRDLMHQIDLLQRNILHAPETLKPEVRLALYRPFAWHQEDLRELIDLCLLKMQPVDYLSLYKFDEEHFFDLFSEWPENLQQYVERRLLPT